MKGIFWRIDYKAAKHEAALRRAAQQIVISVPMAVTFVWSVAIIIRVVWGMATGQPLPSLDWEWIQIPLVAVGGFYVPFFLLAWVNFGERQLIYVTAFSTIMLPVGYIGMKAVLNGMLGAAVPLFMFTSFMITGPDVVNGILCTDKEKYIPGAFEATMNQLLRQR